MITLARMAATDYRALTARTIKPGAGALHLIREDAEAALCGIPRGVLEPGEPDQFVCLDCIEWLTRRRAVSAKFQSIRRPQTP